MIRSTDLLSVIALCATLCAFTPAMGSVEAARTFARGMAEELGLEVTDCGKEFLARHSGEEHLCARTDLPFRRFAAAWDSAAPTRAPRGVKQFGRWTKTAGNDGQRQGYEIQGTPLRVTYIAAKGPKSVTVSYSDYTWNLWPCVDGRYDELGDVFDGDDDALITGGQLVNRPHPDYPESARVARIEGRVRLEVLIDKEGQVRDVCVTVPANRGVGFEKAAIQAARLWKYQPATRGGVPVQVIRAVTTEFKLP